MSKIILILLGSLILNCSSFSQRNGYSDARPPRPLSVYISWAAHDELSDTVRLTEKLAMKEFEAMVQLRKQGVQFDYYLMDMFWFDKNGGFREFRKDAWPNGPDVWLKACKDHNVLPGLWISTNVTGWSQDPWLKVKPEWAGSAGGYLNQTMSLHSGGFLKYHIQTLQYWYDKGVRMFKFDFANFKVHTETTRMLYTDLENELKNQQAWRDALKEFRIKNPDVMLLAYNGYGGESSTTFPFFNKTVDVKWLEAFSSLYCGDPRPADVPCMNFWRSKDIYSDHMVFQYAMNGIPLDRIDNTAFMIGTTGTCYFREKQAWKGMLILSAARGGWMNTYYGNLDLLNEEDGKWFAKVQKTFYPLQEFGRFSVFGEIPGTGKPYGFLARQQSGELVTIVNPSHSVQKLSFPDGGWNESRILFTDAGYKPLLEGNTLTLGPEQMVLIGLGSYADASFDLGIQEDVIIPSSIAPLETNFTQASKNTLQTKLTYNGNEDVRLVFSLTDPEGKPLRLSGGAPPAGIFLSEFLNIEVKQKGKKLPLDIRYDKQIWSGLSWAVAELRNSHIQKGIPLEITFKAKTEKECQIIGNLFTVSYSQ